MEVIEENVPVELLDEREKYWIKYFDSYYSSGKGYNMTQGGQWGNSSQILTPRQADEIKELILISNLTFEQIGEQYGVSLHAISDINRGKTFYEQNRNYPLRPFAEKSIITEEKLNIIIDLLLNTTKTHAEIAKIVDIHEYTVGQINRGDNSWCPANLSYPIRKPIQEHTHNNILTKEKVILICKDLCFSSLTQKQIGEQYGVAKNTIGDISRGISWKEITHQFIRPITSNKEENKKIFQSIYGIV